MEGTRRCRDGAAAGADHTLKTLIYLHLPKCGGTSFNQLLRANYPGFVRITPGGGWENWRYRPGTQCISGHMPWGIDTKIPGPCQYITILRDPVERVVSLWRFIRGWKKHRHYEAAMGMGLGEFATSGLFADLDNGMTRWLAGRPDVGSAPALCRVGPDDLRQAQVHLAQAVYGTLDHYAEFVARLAGMYGWQHTEGPWKMRATWAGTYTAHELDIVRRANSYDVDLYKGAAA